MDKLTLRSDINRTSNSQTIIYLGDGTHSFPVDDLEYIYARGRDAWCEGEGTDGQHIIL